jgi:hypothetical protein
VLDSDITRDVHALEQYKYILFCWTKPHAKFTFTNAIPLQHLEIQIAPIPGSWQDMQKRGFAVVANGQKLSVARFHPKKNRIFLNLPSTLTSNESVLKLELRVATPFPAKNDTRSLGLPLSRIRFFS